MEEIYYLIRVFYFTWAGLLFWYMLWWGVQDVVVGHRCGHIQVPPEHHFFALGCLMAALVLDLSISEIVLEGVDGGWRTFLPFLFLTPATIASYLGAYRVKMHRIAVEGGYCGGEIPHEHI